MSEFNPSSVEVIKAEIISYDNSTVRNIATNYIYSWELTQSMDAVSYKGSLSILDSSGLLEGMPIRGEETLYLWLKGMDLNTTVKISAIIHKVSDIMPAPNSGSLTYKLHFVSAETFKASTKVITKGLEDKPNEMAKYVFEQSFGQLKPLEDSFYLDPDDDTKQLPYQTRRFPIVKAASAANEADRSFFIQNTSNTTKLIIPHLSPSEALFFIAARGYNVFTPSQTFRFFETIENFYFCTDEYFIRKANNTNSAIDLFYAPIVDLDAANARAQVNRIEELHILSKGIDTSTDLFSGAYTNEVVEVDFIRRRIDYSHFNYDNAKYIDMSGTTRSLDDNPHTADFRRAAFTKENARRFMTFRNYARPGDAASNILPDQHLPEIVHNRVSYYHHLNNTTLMCAMKGRLDIRPGMLINLDIKELDSVSSNLTGNKSLSGKYLVQQTNHTMREDILHTTLKLAKFDWSGQQSLAETSTADIPNEGPR